MIQHIHLTCNLTKTPCSTNTNPLVLHKPLNIVSSTTVKNCPHVSERCVLYCSACRKLGNDCVFRQLFLMWPYGHGILLNTFRAVSPVWGTDQSKHKLQWKLKLKLMQAIFENIGGTMVVLKELYYC